MEHLQIERGKPVAGGSTDVCDPKYAMRYYLAAKIAERGLHREQLPRNVVRKQRGKRGRKKKAAAAGGHKKKKASRSSEVHMSPSPPPSKHTQNYQIADKPRAVTI